MNRSAFATALIVASAFATTYVPPVAADDPADSITWTGVSDYRLSPNGGIEIHELTPGCDVTPTARYALPNSEQAVSTPNTAASGSSTTTCLPRVPTELTRGKTPTCVAAFVAYYQGVAAGVILGHVWCDGVAKAELYCVGTVGVPCTATVTLTPSSSGGCDVTATGVVVTGWGSLRVICKVTITWV